jgi:hypothetical protein
VVVVAATVAEAVVAAAVVTVAEGEAAAVVVAVVAAADMVAAAIATASFSLLLSKQISLLSRAKPRALVSPSAFRRARGAVERSLFAFNALQATAPRRLVPIAPSEAVSARVTGCGSPASTCPLR